MGRMEWSEVGGKWDNCNSIINKYIFKNVKWYSHCGKIVWSFFKKLNIELPYRTKMAP